MKLETTHINTPLGIAVISGNKDGIQSVKLLTNEESVAQEEVIIDIPECLKNCVTQLKEYFDNKRTQFNLKLNPQGTTFQKKVWQSLLDIPYNSTTTYLEQSKQLGNIKAIRAVASANGKNPIWIIIPCHRVVGSDGSLTGYAGGIWRKKWLLDFENPVKQQSLF